MTDDQREKPEGEQSMDDILASIRRIMLDEQARLQTGAPAAEHAAAEPDAVEETEQPNVLMLDSSMIIEELPPAPTVSALEPVTLLNELSRPPEALPDAPVIVEHGPAPIEPPHHLLQISTEALPPEPASDDVPSPPVEQVVWAQEDVTVAGGAGSAPTMQDLFSVQSIEALVAPAAAAAAAASVEALLRELRQERAELVQQQAPTIEAVVRSEIRPLLKSWLDEHLPTLVERLVRAEIERLVGGRSGR
jgi:cell pole-organizing protein PopZ